MLIGVIAADVEICDTLRLSRGEKRVKEVLRPGCTCTICKYNMDSRRPPANFQCHWYSRAFISQDAFQNYLVREVFQLA